MTMFGSKAGGGTFVLIVVIKKSGVHGNGIGMRNDLHIDWVKSSPPVASSPKNCYNVK